MQQFRVGDKVQTTEVWGPRYSHAIITNPEPNRIGYIETTWYCPDGMSIEGYRINPKRLYLLESKKKGLCMFLNKVQKEYSNG